MILFCLLVLERINLKINIGGNKLTNCQLFRSINSGFKKVFCFLYVFVRDPIF